MKNLKIALILTIFFLGGFALAKWVLPSNNQQANNNKEIREGIYQFTNPLLECEIYQPSELQNIILIRKKVEALLAQYKENEIAVYFRDLNNGPWFGINEKISFTPSSLLKVPLLMAYLKYAENSPEIFKEKIVYDLKASESVEKLSFNQNFVSSYEQLKLGETYTVEELLIRMITASDNEAAILLYASMEPKAKNEVYKDLGLAVPQPEISENFIRVKDYATFFRILFNASYLNRQMSEKALEILSKTEFKNGIVAGVPSNIIVSHKFGERTFASENDNNIKQLHDCGIVYYPEHPYLLCIMTRGEDFQKLAEIIREISALIYNEIKGGGF